MGRSGLEVSLNELACSPTTSTALTWTAVPPVFLMATFSSDRPSPRTPLNTASSGVTCRSSWTFCTLRPASGGAAGRGACGRGGGQPPSAIEARTATVRRSTGPYIAGTRTSDARLRGGPGRVGRLTGAGPGHRGLQAPEQAVHLGRGPQPLEQALGRAAV